MGAKGVGQTRAHGLMVRCRREAWSDKRSLHNAPCELEILLECDRMVFLWIRRTPDRHIPHRANFTLSVFFDSPFSFPSFVFYLKVAGEEAIPVVVTVKRKNQSRERGRKGERFTQRIQHLTRYLVCQSYG